MNANVVKTYEKGQIVIPGEIRKKLRIGAGTRMRIFEHQGIIYLIPPVKNPLRSALGCLPRIPSLSKALLKERKKDF